jgi:thioredoxin:protein disulfide reductase
MALRTISTFTLVCGIFIPFLSAEEYTFTTQRLDDQTHTITIAVQLAPKEALFSNSIHFYLNHPTARLISWHTDQQPVPLFDPSFQETKLSYTGTPHFYLTITEPEPTTGSPTLLMRYLLNTHKEMREKLFSVPLNNQAIDSFALAEPTSPKESPTDSTSAPTINTYIHQAITTMVDSLKQFGSHITKTIMLITFNASWWLQFILVFMLGILMSLTPCLYPMIPITIGILQATDSGKKSFFKNFLLALSYTTGMSTTFAIMGFLTATGTARFGQLLGSPFFIIILVLFLAYLGCSMFGWYELYIPRFLQPRNHQVKKGSFLSTFIFGMLSGTFASPCLSPGLALVLSMVTSQSNSLRSLPLLFIFGIGSSFPLLIIGTFSNSINLLPRSGLWMVEIKKLFGFMLLGMCIYYLQSLLSATIINWLLSSLFLAIGLYYLVAIDRLRRPFLRRTFYLVGILSIAAGLFILLYSYKDTHQEMSLWQHDYHDARNEARQHHKKMLIDFTAQWCSLCHEITKTVLAPPVVQSLLSHVVPVAIDCTNMESEQCIALQKKYAIVGLPTLLLVDPETEQIIKRWGSEILEQSRCDFKNELMHVLQTPS